MNTDTFPRTILDTDGKTTCLWHRQWEWTMANYVPTMPHCTICGGVCDPRITAHELCKARQARGLPTPIIDNTPVCGCAKCVSARK